MAEFKIPTRLTLDGTTNAQQALLSNSAAQTRIIENRGPGNVYWSPSKTVTIDVGHRLRPNATLIFENCEHTGEVWLISDQAATDVVVSESQ